MIGKLKHVGVLFLLPWLVIGVFGSRYVAAAPTSAPQTWMVMMGQQVFTDPGQKATWFGYSFYPDNLTINAGDTVTWMHNADGDVHTVTFLGPNDTLPDFIQAPPGAPPGPPQAPPSGPLPKLDINPAVVFPAGSNSYDGSAFTSSGVIAQNIPGPHEYSLTFPKPGTYKYYCLIHSQQYPDGTRKPMVGTVTVLPAGSALPMTPAQVEAAGQQDMADDAALATGHVDAAKNSAPPDSPGPNGTTIHHVSVGYIVETDDKDQMDNMRFSPATLTIDQGDTVVWTSPTAHAFHNVLFGEKPDSPLNIEPQPQGPPKVTSPFEVFFPVGGSEYDGTGIHSAGIIQGLQDPPGPFSTSYSLTFTQPGQYDYVCGLHYSQGMQGTIIVRARTGGQVVGMPRTGSGDGTAWLPSAAAGALLALTGAVVLLRRRKSDETV